MSLLRSFRRWHDYQLLWRNPPIVPMVLVGMLLVSLAGLLALAGGLIDSSLPLKSEQLENVDKRVLTQFAANDAASLGAAEQLDVSESERTELNAIAARAIGDAAIILADEPDAALDGWNSAFGNDMQSQAAAGTIARTRICPLGQWGTELRPVIRALVIADFTGQCSALQKLEARSFLLSRIGSWGWLLVAMVAGLIGYTLFRVLAAARVRSAYRWLYRSAVVDGEAQ